jgi:CcmD family protein
MVFLLVGLLGGAGNALAEQASQPPDPQDEFVPVKDLPQQEQLPGGPLVLAAYGFVWAALLVYVWTIWRRLHKVEQEIRSLSSRVGAQHASGVGESRPQVRD